MGEWKLISRPPGKKAAKIMQGLGGGGCIQTIILLPLRMLYVAWRLNILYNWEGVWTNGQFASVRVFSDRKTIGATLWDAFITGTAWKEETNDAKIVHNREISQRSLFGDTLLIIAPGDSKFPPIEVLNAEDTWQALRQEVAQHTKLVQQVAKQDTILAEAKHSLAVQDAIERLQDERRGGQ